MQRSEELLISESYFVRLAVSFNTQTKKVLVPCVQVSVLFFCDSKKLNLFNKQELLNLGIECH